MRLAIPALAAGLLLVGCGSDGAATTGLDTPGAVVPPTATVPAPPATTETVPNIVPPSGTPTETNATVPDADQPMPCPHGKDGAARDAFDARELEGRTLADAQAAAKAHGCSVRVARRDGERLVLTQDLVTSRINVEVTEGRVTRVLSVA